MEKKAVNSRVKEELRKNNVKVWQLADALGVSEMSVYRYMRHELPMEEQERYIHLIRNKAAEQ